MYAGLFLMPWILMYGLSTIAMNHREAFKRYYGGQIVSWLKLSEQPYTGHFSDQTKPQPMAEQILRDLNMEGKYNVSKSSSPKLTITRLDPIAPKRITYTPSTGMLVLEKQEFRVQPFLETFHRRRGYDNRYTVDNIWALSIDITIVGILLWVLSGVWMWWELKVTRRLGLVCVAIGLTLFLGFTLSL
jgi:hypothetical protein